VAARGARAAARPEKAGRRPDGAEFEHSIIPERVVAGMVRAKAKGTRSGKAIGRPALAPELRAKIRAAYMAGGVGMRGVAKQFGVGAETVRRCLV
jgi:DNA invertase Pin-like site-specific DNA recombinase